MKSLFLRHYGENQHAYRPRGSTSSALIQMHDTVTSYMDNNENASVRLLCLDMSKAFDKVQHCRLVNRLRDLDFNEGFLLWLISYLQDRYQRIYVNGLTGSLFSVTSGVPQGSVLGPYLFNVFLSSLEVNSGDAVLVKFADDLTLIEACAKDGTCPSFLPLIKSWMTSNNMVLNQTKSRQMIFHCSKIQLSQPYDGIAVAESLNILGVTWSSNLEWNSHFSSVIRSANRRLFVLRELKPFVDKLDLVKVFNSLVLSLLFYCTPLFGELRRSTLKKIEQLLRRAHFIMCGESCTCQFKTEFVAKRKTLVLNFVSKCELTDHPLNHLLPPRLPRTNHFRLSHSLTSRRMNSFFPMACCLANVERRI